jgi:hypothetical protein
MNKYLVKMAMTIVDTKDRYGISANKTLNNRHLIDALIRASRSSEVQVTIKDNTGRVHKGRHAERLLSGIKREQGPRGWNRDYTWSVTLAKNSPRRAPYKTEKGKNFATIAILHRYYNL